MLEPHQDAYGQMMLDYLDHGGGYEITEHDDGYVGVGAGPRLYFSEYDQWRQVECDALELVEGRVLDVGCGAGRFMLWLRERGHDVVGIDNSPGAIEACRRRGLDDVHVLSIGKVSSKRLGLFDTLLLLGGNMALLGAEDQAKRNLARLARVTKPGGRLFGANRDWSKSSDERTRTKAAENVEAGRFTGEHRVRIRYKTFATPYYTSSRMSVDELRGLIGGTGWELSEVLDRDEGIYVAVLTKQ